MPRSRPASTRVQLIVVLLASGAASIGAQPPPRPDTAHAAAEPRATGRGMRAMMTGPLGLPMTRAGSGTAWVPDSTPMYARMFEAGSWGLMFHGVAFGQYDHQGGPRGGSQVGSVNWGMLMAARDLGRPTPDGGGSAGRLEFRGMMSLEPFTVGSRGYPLLLQTGEAYHGQPLHDRQHPHDLFMELAALYEKPLAPDLGLQLYAAPVGEPALGPVAFPHRPSAAADPFATLGHHWEDATHISFGVLTAGLFTRALKLEGSVFNGREPDEVRTNFDYKGRSLDSYAGRLSVNPSPYISLSAAVGYLKSPEALHPAQSVHRTTVSALYGRPFGVRGGAASVSLLYGVNRSAGLAASPSGGLEGLLDLDGTNSVFVRVETSRKTAEDLALPSTVVPDARGQFALGSVAAGYVREVLHNVGRLRGASLGLGGEATVNRVPGSLVPVYGSRSPVGFALYLRLRPSRMSMAMAPMGMGGMPMTMASPTDAAAGRQTTAGAMSMPMPPSSGTRTPRARDTAAADTSGMAGMQMPGMRTSGAAAAADTAVRQGSHAVSVMSPTAVAVTRLVEELVADPVIRRRVMRDPALRRSVAARVAELPPEARTRIEGVLRRAGAATARPSHHAPASRPVRRPATHDTMPGMAHGTMPGMGTP